MFFSLTECCCTLSLPLPQDNFLISQHDSSSTEAPNSLLPHTGSPFWSKHVDFPVPLILPSTTLARTAQLFLIFRLHPLLPLFFCCSTLPERAQVLPGGNDCYLQDTLRITSTPFGVFRPSSFCCISHFPPRSRVLKDQGLLFTGESRQGRRDTFCLPRMSLKTLWRHSKHASSNNKNLQADDLWSKGPWMFQV